MVLAFHLLSASLTKNTVYAENTRKMHYNKYFLKFKHKNKGFTLVELLVVVAILSILSLISTIYFLSYMKDARIQIAISNIKTIEKSIALFEIEHGRLPDSLSEVGQDGLKDPWGNPFVYLRINGGNTPGLTGKIRKDRNLHPVNTDYDLYSKGEDGDTSTQFVAQKARDDIVRANNGRYLGLAEDHIPL